MKKLSIFLLGALGMIAAACDDAPEVAKPQVNPQEPVLASGDVVSSPTGALTVADPNYVNLQEYKAEDAPVPVMKLDETKNLPAGATISYKLELSKTDTFSDVQSMDALEGADNIFYVAYDQWAAAHQALFGKNPAPTAVYYRVPVYVTFDGSDYRYESTDFYAAQGQLLVAGVDPGFMVYDNYYLLSEATTLQLADVKDFAFTHNNPDVSIWDDPNFTINFQVKQDQLDANNGVVTWQIAGTNATTVDASTAHMYGPSENGEEAETGYLAAGTTKGNITVAGKYEMRINLEKLTYEIEFLKQPNHIFTPGDSNGWNQDASAWLQLDEGRGLYYGLSPLTGGFKICEQNKWDNSTDWGAKSGDPADKGELMLGGAASNITPASTGLFWINVTFNAASYALETYELVPVTRIGVIGSFAASGWGSDIEMTSADGGKTYTADVDLEAGNEFKFRMNNEWTYDLGGDMAHLTWGGSNIKAEDTGTFTITLNLMGGYPRCTLTKK